MAKFVFIDVTVTVSYGGVQTAVWHLAKELYDQGHEVTVFGGHGPLQPDLQGRAITVHRFPFVARDKIPHFGNRFRRIGERFSMALAARKTFLQGKFDWAILTKPTDFFWPWLIPADCPTRFALRSGGTDFYPGDRLLAKRIDAWFANSHFNAYQIQQRYRRYPTVIYNGVDTARFSPERYDRSLRQQWGVADQETLFFFAGRLVGWKGLHLAVQAMAHPLLADQPARLLLLGDGPERQRLQQLARSLNQEGRIFFHDGVPHQQLPPFHASADVGLFPSIGDEGFSNSMAESLSSGKPVIATAFSGNPETIGNEGSCGILVPPRRSDLLAEAMHQLCTDRPLRQRMGEAARQRILNHFTWPRVVQRLLDGLTSAQPSA
ncbi:MAG: glycosyltransferase family 4 protein [Magnetococcales bacterium]|nr:glycosyltransferase family 4 protein [Magnetococcales bacterium]